MAQVRTAVRTAAAVERRPAVAATIQRSPAAAASSPARALQQRLGNQATQALIARAIAASAAEGTAHAPTQVSISAPSPLQLSAKATRLPAKVSKPNEPAELEAEETARKVLRMQQPEAAAPTTGRASQDNVQRDAAPASAAASPPAAHVNITGGSPLPSGVRSFMEPRFGANFGNVRIHTGESAAQQSAGLNAHAFTVGEHVFFGRDKFQPQSAGGKELIAHELTHTIQQGATVQLSVNHAVTQRSEPRVQRFGVSDALNWIADKANNLPGFRLLTIVLGMNPVNRAPVDRSAANILRALLELIPVTGALLAQALENHGIFAKVGAWIEVQIKALGLAGGALREALDKFLDSLSWSDVLDLDGVCERGKSIFTEPSNRLLAFGKSVAVDILGFIRVALLLPLAKLAEGTRGYDLLKAVLGEDPVTGQPVARSPENLIGGFMKLIGQEEVWENIKKSNAIPRAWAWFQGALAAIMGLVRQIPGLFIVAFKSIEIVDLILVPKAFAKVAGVFGGFIAQFITWAGGAVYTLLEIIFEVVAPSAIPFLKKAAGAFKLIITNPIRFIKNLIAAIKGGIQAFVANIWTHFKTGFIRWLFGALADAGIEIPDGLPSLPSILKLVMNVLGLTMARLKIEATKLLGPTAVAINEKLVEFVQAFWEGGPASLWAKIKEDLTNLKDMAIDAIQDWLITTIVKQSVIKLVSLFNPAGAFIQAILAIYNTIQVIVERISQIPAFVGAVVNSIYGIATGAIGGAIKWIENALAGAIPLVLSFLAGLLGIGGLSAKVSETLEKAGNFVWDAIRKLIRKGIDAVKKLIGKVLGKGKGPEEGDSDVTTLATDRFIELLGKEPTAVKADQAADLVRKEFGGQGLKSFAIRPGKNESEYNVVAAASPEELVAALVPKGKDVVVTMHAEIRLKGEAQSFKDADYLLRVNLPGTSQSAALKDKEYAYLMPPSQIKGLGTDERQFRKSSAVIIAPKSGEGPIEVVAWNAGSNIKKSNVSHAEHAFVVWIMDSGIGWRSRIESIQITVSRSPCGSCVKDLHLLGKNFLSHIDINKKRLAWTDLHCGTNPTTANDVSTLHETWKITGSSPLPPTSDAEHKKVCKEVLKAQRKQRAAEKKKKAIAKLGL